MRALFRERARWVTVDLSGPGVRVLRQVGSRRSEVGRFDGKLSDPDAKPALAKLLRRAGTNEATFVLRIDESRALRKRIDLPIAAEENLKEVVGFEMDRQTPFKANEVYFAERVVSRNEDGQRLTVDLTVIPRGVVDDAVARVRTLGVEPDVVEVGASDEAAPGAMNLLPETERISSFSFATFANVVLIFAALSLCALVLETAFQRQQAALDAMTQRVAVAKEAAEEVSRLREQLQASTRGGRFLRELKSASPAMIEIVDELSRVLPDNTWLYQIRIAQDEIQLWGYSETASKTIALLEASARFSDVTFRSPVTQDRNLDLERFNLAARINSRPEASERE